MEYAKRKLAYIASFFKEHKRSISFTVLIVAISLIGIFVSNNWDDFREISIKNYYSLVFISVALLFNQFATGKGMDTLLRPLGVSLGLKETIGLVSVTRLFNQVGPGRIGLAVRGAYLKKKYDFPYTQFGSSLAAINIIMYAIGSLMGVLAAFFVPLNREVTYFVIFLALILVLICFLFLFTPSISRKENNILKHIQRALDGWYAIRRDRKVLMNASLWTVLNILSQAAVIFFAFSSLGYEINLQFAIFISSLTVLSSLVAITPGGFGITEGIVVGASAALGIPGTIALAAAFVRRFFGFSMSLISTLIFAKPLLGEGVHSLKIKTKQKSHS